MVRSACLIFAALFVGGCSTPGPAPPLPTVTGEPTPPLDEGVDLSNVELGRVDGQPIPDGSMLLMGRLRVDCLPGPDPSLDNEDPAAQAEERWALSLDTLGWASVTNGIRAFLWDGAADPSTDLHRLAFRAGVSMRQVPAGQSVGPYEYDQWSLAIPVLADPVAADSVQGTTLGCSDSGALAAAAHDVMVCALDARDLETVSCWFCGTHLGQSASPPPDTVGRISSAPGPGGASFSVTEVVECTYGSARGAESDR